MTPLPLFGVKFYPEIAYELTLSLSSSQFLVLIQIHFILPDKLPYRIDELDEFDELYQNKNSIILSAQQSKMDRTISFLVLNSALILVLDKFLYLD
jgi:hypothetical protein